MLLEFRMTVNNDEPSGKKNASHCPEGRSLNPVKFCILGKT